MSATTDIRAALRAALKDVPGTVSVGLGPSEYDRNAGRGFNTMKFRVRILIGELNDANEEILDAMFDPDGPASIKTLLEADEALAALAADVQVTHTSGHVVTPDNILGGEWTVKAMTEGS